MTSLVLPPPDYSFQHPPRWLTEVSEGGSVIESDKKVTIYNPNAIKALDTAHS